MNVPLFTLFFFFFLGGGGFMGFGKKLCDIHDS